MSTTTTPVTQPTRAEAAWIRLMRVYQQIDRRTAEIMKKYGLSVSRFDVLVHAGAREGRTQQELADAMFVTKGNICQLLDGMEAEDLLYRRRKGRTNHIFLSDDGRDRRQQAMAEQIQAIESAMSVLTEEEQELLNKLLRKIDKNLATENVWEGQ